MKKTAAIFLCMCMFMLPATTASGGGTMGVGIEATASKGTRLSGDASVSNDAIKDTAKSLAGDSTGGKKASDGFGGFHDNFAKKKKTLWKGEYVLQD